MTNIKKPHKHSEVIKAWADGADIQYHDSDVGQWIDWDCIEGAPGFFEYNEYRVKPEPKPDTVHDVYAYTYGSELGLSNTTRLQPKHNLKLTFDGETGKLKAAEVL